MQSLLSQITTRCPSLGLSCYLAPCEFVGYPRIQKVNGKPNTYVLAVARQTNGASCADAPSETQEEASPGEPAGAPIEPVTYEEPLSARGHEVAASAVQRYRGRRGGDVAEGEWTPAGGAQAIEVVPFNQRPPFISGPFKVSPQTLNLYTLHPTLSRSSCLHEP